ncbi:hypothetical protein [uncultured Alistipes sp.]|uniref:hypothetical protein n=1 Tax=uncultured Alistipes sp. TaxID=538949 RepID=UPI00262F8BE8|nr:hypothetical protein [uncultured Alistipes sp.]
MTLGALTRSVVTVGMVMLFTACDKDKEMDDDNGDLPFCESLIGSYTDTPTSEDMVRIAALCPSQTDWPDVSFFMIQRDSYEAATIHSLWGTSFDDEALARQNAAKYDSLSKAHNDLDYNRRTLTMVLECLYRRTTGIHVVSDTDYDEEHPAGTYLDDIIRIHFKSAEDYLATGYTSLKQYLGKTTRSSSYYGASDLDLSEYLDEFNHIQRKLIRFSFNFRLTKAPDRTGTHRFTITYTNEDGVELTGTIEPITVRR